MLAILYLLPSNPTLSLTPSPLIRLQASTPKASLIYKRFTSPDLFRDKLKIELQWEANLGYAWPVTFWNKMLSRVFKISTSASTSQCLFFLYHRLYQTPPSIAKFSNTNNTACWSCYHLNGDLMHFLFLYPPTASFWENVWMQLTKILEVQCTMSPILLFLGSLFEFTELNVHKNGLFDLM